MSSSNCCFLTCIEVSQEASQVVWYSHFFQNFPQFIVIHTVKGFGMHTHTHTHTHTNTHLACKLRLLNSSSVQSLSSVQLLATPWTVACQASMSITNSLSLLTFMSIKSVMPSNQLTAPPTPNDSECIRSGICWCWWDTVSANPENSERVWNTRPPDLPLEKPICRLGSSG